MWCECGVQVVCVSGVCVSDVCVSGVSVVCMSEFAYVCFCACVVCTVNENVAGNIIYPWGMNCIAHIQCIYI